MENNITPELLTALAKFQKQVKAVEKDTKGHGYKYASLPQTMETIKPILDDCDLILMQPIGGDSENIEVETIIAHISGGLICSKVSAPHGASGGRMSQIQQFGSIVTYLRRYSLSILGIVTDEDTDGHEVNFQKKQSKPKPSIEQFKKMLEFAHKKDQKMLDKALNNYDLTIPQRDELMEVFNGKSSPTNKGSSSTLLPP